ncbi:MAG: PQQ-binding-like beta-propeller repeat protein [Muribaculaceae bacterium]
MKKVKLLKRLGACIVFALIGALSVSATKVVVLADPHVTPGNENDIKLREVVAEINEGDGDVVVLAGDLTNEGSDEQLKNIKAILDGIKKPLYVIPGNHENNWSQSATKTFNDLWGNDRFVAEVDDIVIVGINCGPYMKMGDGHIKQEDLSWLDKTLAEHVKAGKRVLSVNHYPIMADLDNCNDYVKILQKYPVMAHICGHYHTFRQYKGGDIDALMCRSLDMKKGNYGYSILDISNDSIKVYDKQLAGATTQMFAFKINKNIQPLKELDKEVYTLPVGVKIDLVHRDEASIFTRIGVDKHNIYIGNSLGEAKAINKKTSECMWSVKTDASLFSRPAITPKNVIIPTADCRLLWIDKKNGKILKDKASQGPYVADGVMLDNCLYQGGYKLFEAWNATTGKLLWRNTDFDNYCQAAPVVNGDDVILGAWDTYLRCIDRSTGALKWKWNNGKSANMLGPGNCVPVVTSDKVIIVAPDRYMTAIDRKTGKQIWRSNKYKVRESLGTSIDGKVAYAKTMDGEIVAVSTEGNEYNPLWIIDAGLGYEHAPCIVIENKGIVYMGSRAGMMVAIDPIAKKVLWRYRLGTSEFNGWDIDEKGDLYTSLIEGTVWRITTAK